MSPTNKDLSNDTTFSQIKSCVPVPLKKGKNDILILKNYLGHRGGEGGGNSGAGYARLLWRQGENSHS